MPRKKQKHCSKTCECSLLSDPFFYPSWTNQPCPFFPTRKYKQSQDRQYEILQLLECSCGKQVGQRIFSSDRLIGFWRSSNNTIIKSYVNDLSQQFETNINKMISKNINLLTLYENKEKQQPIANSQDRHITPLKHSITRSKSKSKSKKKDTIMYK